MTIRYEVRDRIAYFVIDNGKVNAFTPEMHKAFYHQLVDFEIDPNVSVGILMGAPGKPFSAGDDIKSPRGPRPNPQKELDSYLFLHQGEGPTPSRPGWDLDVLAHRRYKPIIAAVDGHCLGKGFIYVLLHSDIRIATETARFGLPEIAYGMAGTSCWTRLARQVPWTAAAYIALTGRPIDAAHALRVNLINAIVPPEDLLAEAEGIARCIAQMPTSAVRVEMEALFDGLELGRADAVRHGQNLYRLLRLGYEGFGSNPEEILARSKRADDGTRAP